MQKRIKDVMDLLTSVEARLIRVESRIVQLMNHMGIKPKGVLPDENRRTKP